MFQKLLPFQESWTQTQEETLQGLPAELGAPEHCNVPVLKAQLAFQQKIHLETSH